MKIDLIPFKKLIQLNKLMEVTDPILFEKGSEPTIGGLLSTEIFGSSLSNRKTRFAYVSLGGHFLHPFIYKLLKRMNRNFDAMVHGSKRFRVEDGNLIEDEEKGDTGLEYLYKIWDTLNFEKNNSMMRNERIDVLNAFSKDTIFTEYYIVIPAFFRDVNLQSAQNGKISHHEINDKYTKLLRNVSVLKRSGSFDFQLDSTRAKVQTTLVEIYDLLKGKIEKKHGLIKKSLLGKSIDYGARSVISAPIFNAERPEDMEVDLYHSGIPLAQCCSLFTPFIVSWVRRFFQREIERLGNRYPVRRKDGTIKHVQLKDPDIAFNDEVIKKQIDKFIFSYSDRFSPIELPIDDDEFKKGIHLSFSGRQYKEGVPETESPIIDRPATWCDILYQAAAEVTADAMVYITRYPLLDYFGMFPSQVSILSTMDTVPMYIGDKVYKNYPKIDIAMPPEKVSVYFIDTITMSNLLLHGLGGDYDGDQVTVKAVFSQEANKEAREIMMHKAHILNIYGQNMRKTTNEGIQTLYMMTKFES